MFKASGTSRKIARRQSEKTISNALKKERNPNENPLPKLITLTDFTHNIQTRITLIIYFKNKLLMVSGYLFLVAIPGTSDEQPGTRGM